MQCTGSNLFVTAISTRIWTPRVRHFCCWLASLTPSYFSTLVERPIIHKPNRIYCSYANRPYMVPTAKHISMNAAGAEGGAILGLTALPSLAGLTATVRTGLTWCLKRITQTMHAACVKGGAIQWPTRVINQSKPYNHFANSTYKVPEVQHNCYAGSKAAG